MRATARAPGLAGVFAKGLLGNNTLPFSAPCPADHWATAQVTLHERAPDESGELPQPPPAADEKMAAAMLATPQTAAAIQQTLTHLGRPDLDAHTFI